MIQGASGEIGDKNRQFRPTGIRANIIILKNTVSNSGQISEFKECISWEAWHILNQMN